jgi:type VI secretion system protein ImpE
MRELEERVRKDPSNSGLRTFMFQLLAIGGQWERALTQLKIIGDLDSNALIMVEMYRDALHCELLRQDVFNGRRTPMCFGTPAPWMALLIEALRLSADGKMQQAETLRTQAFDQAPATTGRIDGQDFDWIADADMRLGPVVEAIVNGSYYWIPFAHIQAMKCEAPSDLRDFVWMPVQFIWVNGGQAVGLVPSRYPGSEASEDPQLRLAKKTVWQDDGSGLVVGFGQRLYCTERSEYPLLDIRAIEMDLERG